MNKQCICIAASILACMPVGSASAHESGVYESLEYIHIGRVFLSPTERVHLDKNRGVRAPVEANIGSGGNNTAARKNSQAAGYIVSSSGRARIWKDGDFVAQTYPARFAFRVM